VLPARKEISELERVRDERKHGIVQQGELAENAKVSLEDIDKKINELAKFVSERLTYIKQIEVCFALFSPSIAPVLFIFSHY
jgi:hypothetical protein